MVPRGFGGQNNPMNDNAAIGDWDDWPNNIQNIPNFNLNDDVEGPQELDLNMQPDMQEMIVDPVFAGPQHVGMPLDLNEFPNQVNEEAEDNQVEQDDPALMQGLQNRSWTSPQLLKSIFLLSMNLRTFCPWKFKRMNSWQMGKSSSC